MIVGVLAAGQLGRMMALEGYPLGLRFRFLEPRPGAPAATLAEIIEAPYDDEEALNRFADGLDVATYEFENIPLCSTEILSRKVDVFPPPQALKTAQDRILEKSLFERLGIPTSPFMEIHCHDDFERALEEIGVPMVLKTARMGYDGKGQAVIKDRVNAETHYRSLGNVALIAERWIPFDRELSLVSVRSRSGELAFYPLVENHHRHGILRETLAPAPYLNLKLQAEAEEIARRVLTHFDYAGVLTIEFFETNGTLLANEMASRVHNSGHWTIEGTACSQFENHVRAILNLPLGCTQAIGFSTMINLIGETPPVREVLSVPGAHLHLYGKTPRPGRKIGHITLTAPAAEERDRKVNRLVETCGLDRVRPQPAQMIST